MSQFGTRGNDLSKTLDPRELAKIRALIGERPDLSGVPTPQGDELYPKLLYHPAFYAAQQAWKTNADPKEKSRLQNDMTRATQKVLDLEDELAWLEDGWLLSYADALPKDQDPRIARGREGRRAAVENARSVQDEIAELQRRLAVLTGAVGAAPTPIVPKKTVARAKAPRRPVRATDPADGVDAAA